VQFVGVPPPRGQRGTTRGTLPPVTAGVPVAQPERGHGHARTHGDQAGAMAVERLLDSQPLLEIRRAVHAALHGFPGVVVTMTQPKATPHRRPRRTDPAWAVPLPVGAVQRGRGGQELRPGGPGSARPGVLRPVVVTQLDAAGAGPFTAGDGALPPVDAVVVGDLDDGGPVDRFERGRADQGGQDLQPVRRDPIRPVPGQLRQRVSGVHRPSPHTVRRAAAKAASWTSTWP
jgi:hypothetical protein